MSVHENTERRRYRIRHHTDNELLVSLIERRKALNLTQKAVAQRLKRSPAHVNDWETGKNEPNLRNLQSWCDALGVKLTILTIA
jgi:DNA-binding transcriptional regulator YiaG